MNKNTLTLESVQAAFSHWREQRLKRNEPIPEGCDRHLGIEIGWTMN